MEFDEMKRNTSNWSTFSMLLRRAGLTASAALSWSCIQYIQHHHHLPVYYIVGKTQLWTLDTHHT